MSDPVQINAGGGNPSAPADPKFYGENYVHGLPSGVITVLENLGVAVTDFTPKRSAEFMSQAGGPKGLMVAVARSPEKIEVSISGFLLEEDAFNDAEDFTYDGCLFIVGTKTPAYKAGEFVKVDFDATSWPGITS